LKDVKEISRPKLSPTGSLLCPVTLHELDDWVTRSYFIWSCGCLVSQAALDLQKDSTFCPSCNSKYTKDDLVELSSEKTKKRKAGEISRPEAVKSRWDKEREKMTGDALAKYKDDESFQKIFKSGQPVRKDAFGREFSNRGFGV